MDFAEVMNLWKLEVSFALDYFLVLAEYQVFVFFLVSRSWLNKHNLREPYRNRKKIVSVLWPPE